MPGLDPGIHAHLPTWREDADGRDYSWRRCETPSLAERHVPRDIFIRKVEVKDAVSLSTAETTPQRSDGLARPRICTCYFSEIMLLFAHPVLMQRGVRVVTIRRGGERWPWVCQALWRGRMTARGRSSRVVLASRCWRQVSDDVRASSRTTGANKPVPGESAEQPLNPSRREGRDVSAEPVVPAACIFLSRRAMGAASSRPSLRPRQFRGS